MIKKVIIVGSGNAALCAGIAALEMGAGAIMLLILSPWMGIDRYYPQFDPNNILFLR